MSKRKHNDFEDEEAIGDPPTDDTLYTDEEIERFDEDEEEDDDRFRDDPSGDLDL